MQKITPFLWFDGNAEEAINFYVATFKNSSIGAVSRWGTENPAMKGKILTAGFVLEGQSFLALNGGPQFKFNNAISFLVDCHSQEEVDSLWNTLADGGEEQPCGWVKDKFGLSWQIIPTVLSKLMTDKDPAKSGRVMRAMMKMKKIIIKDLQDAYEAD